MHTDVKEESIFGSMYKKLATGITYNEINGQAEYGQRKKHSTFQYTLLYKYI